MPEEELEKILEQDMGGRRKTWEVRLRNWKEDDSPLRMMEIPWIEFFHKAGSYFLRSFLILVIAGLVLAAGIYWYRHRERSRSPAQSSVVLPDSQPPPPQALLEEAEALYRRGFLREAWGRCYAASLEALKLRWGLRFPPGATEYRCLALVRLRGARFREQAEPATELAEASFAGLIRHWVGFFYGGIVPPEGAFEEALAWIGSLCGNPGEKPAPGDPKAPEGAHG
jgi:hypothetical protein